MAANEQGHAMVENSGQSGHRPIVSVIMSVHNGEPYLREAIDSILAQSFTDFEFLIVNDCSSDNSQRIIISYGDPRVRLVDNPTNIGLTKSLNKALALSRGHYVARMDADDRSHKERLAKQVEFLNENPRVAVVGTQIQPIDAEGKTIRKGGSRKAVDPVALAWHWIFDNPLAHSTTLFRREIIWERMKGYDETFRTSQDFELWSRVAHLYEICNLDEVLVDFRLHANSVSRRYTTEDVIKLTPVYRQNLGRILQTSEFPQEFATRWLHITMPALTKIGNPTEVLAMFKDVRCRFLAVYPEAYRNKQVRAHCAAVLMRCARYYAPSDRLGSLKFMFATLRMGQLPIRELIICSLFLMPGARSLMKRLR
ncbi:MAG: glycosyltransferase [Nibricoccus sp.]